MTNENFFSSHHMSNGPSREFSHSFVRTTTPQHEMRLTSHFSEPSSDGSLEPAWSESDGSGGPAPVRPIRRLPPANVISAHYRLQHAMRAPAPAGALHGLGIANVPGLDTVGMPSPQRPQAIGEQFETAWMNVGSQDRHNAMFPTYVVDPQTGIAPMLTQRSPMPHAPPWRPWVVADAPAVSLTHAEQLPRQREAAHRPVTQSPMFIHSPEDLMRAFDARFTMSEAYIPVSRGASVDMDFDWRGGLAPHSSPNMTTPSEVDIGSPLHRVFRSPPEALESERAKRSRHI